MPAKTAKSGQKRGNKGAVHRVRHRPPKPGDFTGRDDPRNGTAGQFVNGFDPRRAVQHPFGQTFAYWLNELDRALPDGRAAYPKATLRKIAADPDIQPTKRKAAKSHLRGETDGFSKAGIPLAGNDLDRMCDRTVGKPLQASITVKAELPPAEALEAMRGILKNPQLKALLVGLLAEPDAPALPPGSDNYAPEVVSEQISGESPPGTG